MKSSSYWKDRANLRMNSYHKNSDKTIYKINNAYDKAIEDINKDIKNIFYKFQSDSGMSIAEAKDLLNTKIPKSELESIRSKINGIQDKNLKRYLMDQLNTKAYNSRMTRLEALKESIYINTKRIADVEFVQSELRYIKNINEAYYRNIYDIQKGTGIVTDFATMPVSAIEEILKNNWSGKHYSERVWGNSEVLAAKLEEVITSGLMSGKSSKNMAVELADLSQYGKMAAERLVRTETTYVTNMAELESYKEIGIGRYIFVATLDLRTSKQCRNMDGTIINIEKGVPGENLPPLHPWCRSTTRAYLEGMKRERRARDPETGKNYIIEDMDYKEWYQKCVIDKYGEQKAETFQKMIRNKTSDKKQYKEYSKRLGKDAPRSFTDFRELKYNNSEGWSKLKQSYQIVNLYKVDFGSISATKILELDKLAFEAKRNNQISKYKTQGNFAVMQYNNKVKFASSRISSDSSQYFIKYKGNKDDLVLLKDEPFFKTLGPGDIVDGEINEIYRFHDTEAKFFEYLHDQLKKEDIKDIYMLSEKKMCESCRKVAEQFMKVHSNIKVNVVSGKTLDTWKGRK